MPNRTGIFWDREGGRIPLLYIDMLDDTYAIRTVVVNPDGTLVGSGGGGGPTANVNLNQVGGVAITLGQKVMAASLPITIASDQSALPVTGTFWQVTQPVSAAALPLPTGASTEATLLNVLTTAAFQARINTLGQKVMASSTPVVISSDQSAIAITAASLPLPTGAATDRTTAAGPSSVRLSDGAAFYDATKTGQLPAALVGGRLDVNIGATIALPVTDNGGSLTVDAPVGTPVFVRLSDGAAALIGQKVMTASLPVVIASDQSNLPVNITQVGGVAITLAQKVMASSLPVVIASDQSAIPVNGDIDHDAVNTLKNIQMAGHASPVQTAPAAVSATGDRVRIWVDPRGGQIIRHRELQTYRSVFRLAARPYALSSAFAAAGRKQYATLYHLNTSTKVLRLVRVWAGVRTLSGAGIVSVELVGLTAAVTPATPNPAITAQPHRVGGGAAEAVSMALPTTGGTEVTNSIYAYREVQASAASAIGTATNIPARGGFVTSGASTAPTDGLSDLPPLYEDGNDREQESLIVPNGVAGGFAVVFDSNAVITVTGFAVIEFTEETP